MVSPLLLAVLAAVCALTGVSALQDGPQAKPLLTEDMTSRRFARKAGSQAEQLCKGLATSFKPADGLQINNTFSQYFPEGTMPSLEQLSDTYPEGTIPKKVNVPNILESVGPDIDIKADSGYGKANTRASTHGPRGSMPAFCRFGAFVITSPVTTVLSEVWLPLAADPSIPLAPVNEDDYPLSTNTTSFVIGEGGKFDRVPLFVEKGWVKKVTPSPGSKVPPAPNDVPEQKSDKSKAAAGGDKPESSNKLSKTAAEDPAAASVRKPESDDTSASPSTIPNGPQPRPGPNPVKKRKAHPSDVLEGDHVLGKGDGWNGRLVVMGNGAQRGFVPLSDLKQYLTRYGFAVAGTNGGHFSAASGVTWVNGTQFDETMLDFGSRANHVTLLLAKQVIDSFYGPKAGVRKAKGNSLRAYYAGSSVGAARGLSAVQVYPKDFDGVLLGPPANDFMNLNVGQLHIASVHNKTTAGKGWFTENSLYGPIKDVVTRQCDSLDGVKDGIISNPFRCKPKIELEMLCGTETKYGKSPDTCLTQEQIKNFYKLYDPTVIEGQKVYDAWLPGLEDSATSMKGSNAKASGWHQLAVLKKPELDPSFNPFTDIHLADLKAGNAADPGGVNAVKTDLSQFVQCGGKLMIYHGLYDLVVSPLATIHYYEQVLKDTSAQTGKRANRSVKLYLVPGMQHSRDGPGAWHFGGSTQADPGNRPLRYDTKHDMTLAMIAWVEHGLEPSEQITAKYQMRSAVLPTREGADGDGPVTDLPLPSTQQNFNWGVDYTRQLCPWPKEAHYVGGEWKGTKGHEAFRCT